MTGGSTTGSSFTGLSPHVKNESKTMTAFEWNLTEEQFTAFRVGLEKDHGDQAQYRNGYKQTIRQFCLVWINPETRDTFDGHISGPDGKHMKFSAHWDGKLQRAFVELEPEAGTKAYSKAQAYADVVNALAVIIGRVAKGKTGRIGTQYWDGWYLMNLKGRKVSKDGQENLKLVVEEEIISSSFASSCVQRGFTMVDHRKGTA